MAILIMEDQSPHPKPFVFVLIFLSSGLIQYSNTVILCCLLLKDINKNVGLQPCMKFLQKFKPP